MTEKASPEECYERNVLFLQKHVPPDDIYCFAETMIHIAYYFMRKYVENVDSLCSCHQDETTMKYLETLFNYLYVRDMEVEEKYRMGFLKLDE